MNSTSPAISIVICTYNRADYIGEAMDSLYQQSLPKDQFEVIIVDNNSTDQTEAVCNAYITTHPDGHFYYLKELRQGASFARNTGAAIAIAPLLCFMDDDAVANKDYLERIISFFNQYKDAGGLGEELYQDIFHQNLIG